ncbi:helix-turn-helix domain-containing protein [Flammeovirgaceae bacterium SG7u.111]|nr:helix-turn-helix domain-containing protein [Flammeovirgaceae bacterium SG7u.132]WPO34197.1 helix-turn-helix domain-containing protein [Flammeovirgaceae bacterium SG7u.111]
MLSKEKKLEITKKTTESSTFKNAPTSIALLQYLVNANIDEHFLKEGIIDMEFFGGSPSSDKSNPRVRVNIYNLRKKLKSYYEKEGANEAWQIKIDKGQYSVRFEKQGLRQAKFLPKYPTYKHLLPYVLLLVIAGAWVISTLPKSKPLIWKGFFDNQHTTNLYIGDAFGYGGKTISGLGGWTRNFQINSLDEYYALLEEKPELKEQTSPLDFNYSTRMAENATHSLARFFTRWEHDFEIKYATKTSFSDIKKGNTIYVGRFLNQKDFVYLFNEANSYFSIEDKKIAFKGHKTISDTTIVISQTGTDLDYTIVSRIPGPNDTEQFFFFSNHDIGVMATVEYFTNPDSLKAFTQKHLQNSPYFTAIYKVKGKERINLKLEPLVVAPM